MKDQLIFDTTDATTIGDSDSVGAYVRSDDGTLITHHTVGADEGLDVYLINSSIVVTATDLDIRDLTAASDSVASWTHDGTGTAITSTVIGADTGLDVNVIGGVDVEVDLSHVDDSVALGDGTNLLTSTTVGADIGLDVYLLNSNIEVTQGTSPWVIGDGGGSITVDATDLDIRDLTAASDSVESWTHDGTGTAITSTVVGADTGLDVNIISDITINDAALANTAVAHAQLTTAAANTAESVVAAALANRKYLWVYNADNQKIWIGGAGVTQATGFPISPGSYMEMRAGAAVDVQVASRKASSDVRTLELS